MTTQLLLALERNVSGRALVVFGTFGLLSSIPQMKFFGSFGLGIPYLEEKLGGINHATVNGDAASLATDNAWWPLIISPTITASYGGIDAEKLPVHIFDSNWVCHLLYGLGFGWQGKATYGGCITSAEPWSMFGRYPLVPFVAIIVAGAALGGLDPLVPRLI